MNQQAGAWGTGSRPPCHCLPPFGNSSCLNWPGGHLCLLLMTMPPFAFGETAAPMPPWARQSRGPVLPWPGLSGPGDVKTASQENSSPHAQGPEDQLLVPSPQSPGLISFLIPGSVQLSHTSHLICICCSPGTVTQLRVPPFGCLLRCHLKEAFPEPSPAKAAAPHDSLPILFYSCHHLTLYNVCIY